MAKNKHLLKLRNMYVDPTTFVERIANDLVGDSLFNDARNGLFLAGQRADKKPLMSCLKTALEQRGILVMCVEFFPSPEWSIPSQINAVLCAAHEKVNPGKAESFKGLTLAESFKLLHEQSGKRLALIIDEAQHALGTSDGENVMFALKSARDQLRERGWPQLLLVLSSSSKEALSPIVDSINAPFWGSFIIDFPEVS